MKWRNHGLGVGALLALAGLIFGVALVGEPKPAVAQLKAEPPIKSGVAPTTDLALVPGNAGAFVHVQVAKVWKNDAMKELRKIAEKAGPKALKALDADYKPAPSTLERVTMVMLPEKGPQIEPKIITILAFGEPFVAGDVRKLYMPTAEPKQAGGKTYYADESQGISMHFADDRTIAFGDAETLPAFLKIAGHPTGPLRDAIAANAGKPMIACVNLKEIAAFAALEGGLPPDLKPLLKAERVTVTVDMDKRVTLTAGIGFANDDDAKAGDAALRKAADMARVELNRPRMEFEQALFDPKKSAKGKFEELSRAVLSFGGLAALNTADEILGELPLKRDGSSIAAKFELPEWATQYIAAALVSAGVALPAVQKMRTAAAVQVSQNNLKQIALAMHNYHDTHGSFPPAAICDKKGKKLLSWRVAILPYIEQNALYDKFKLDQPWDSEHNKPLSAILLRVYMDPRLPNSTGATHYKVFVGKETAFDWLQSKKLTDITDGTSNTVMVVAAGDAVPWAKPEDFEFDSTKPLPDLTKPFPQLILSMCDGSVRSINPAMKDFEKIMKIIIGASDGIVTPDF